LCFQGITGSPQSDPGSEPLCEPGCYYTDTTTCINGQCICKDPTFRFYPSTYECALPIGSPCTPGESKCAATSPCVNIDDPTLTTGMTCSNGVNQGCYTEADCNPGRFLACVNNVCKCDNPLHRIEKNGKCFVRTESKGCSSDGISKPKCEDPNAECTMEEICTCKPGSLLIRGICEVSAVGKSCTSQWECNTGLECKNKVCQCADDSMEYDQELTFCRIMLGDRCDSYNIRDYYRGDICKDNHAKCERDEKRKVKFNVCVCDKSAGYIQKVDPLTGVEVCMKKDE